MVGKLYGIGVGPGDPKLLTLKAVEVLQECDVIAIPANDTDRCVAYQIAFAAVPEIADKEILHVDMPMTKKKDVLDKSHDEGAKLVRHTLDQGHTIGFLILGDPTVYSTYLYIHERVKAAGYETEIVSGIASPLAAAALLNTGLVEMDEQLHIIPATYGMEDVLALSGTKVLMKAGKKIKMIKERLQKSDQQVFFVENCGMASQRILEGVDQLPEDAGYYTIVVLKERK